MASASSASAADPYCDGDGTSGKRIQVVFADTDGAPDPTAVAKITQWIGEVDEAFDVSARQTAAAGFAHPRWVFTAACSSMSTALSVMPISIPNPGGSFSALKTSLRGLGLLSNLDRKYMVYLDTPSSASCFPVADFNPDTEPDPNLNFSNQPAGSESTVARFCRGTWEADPAVVTSTASQHELIHMLGGVNRAAPNSYGGHCWDFWDALCAEDDAVNDDKVTDIDFPFTTHLVPNTYPPVCPHDAMFEGVPQQVLLDCNNDDYFSMNPAPGGYLASCWNTAKSNFLVTSGVTPTTPDPNACKLPVAPPGAASGAAPAGAAAPSKKKCKKKKRKRSAVAAKKCKKKKKK